MTFRIEAPASKSMTQRALVIAALSPGRTRIAGPLVCDDSRYLTDLLRALGCTVTWNDDEASVSPSPLRAPESPVFCGNAGTAVRFGSCFSLLCDGPLTIDGDPHMRKRPIGPLGDALAAMGVDVRYLERDGCPPLCLERTGDVPGEVHVDTSKSSQYASGLMMVAPLLEHGLTVVLTGNIVSVPYLRMTTSMMARAGATVAWDGNRVRIEPGGYPTVEHIDVEADWSGAAFLIAAQRLTGLALEVPHLADEGTSLQGDAAFTNMVLAIEDGTDHLDLTDVPDLIAPLTAVCLFAKQPVRIRGAAHTRIKECDRVAVLCRELRKLGANMREHDDGLDVTPLAEVPSASFTLDPEDDHRMAMTFGIVSLRVPGISVQNPGCVSKSFPDFWDKLQMIRERSTALGEDPPP